MLSVYIAIAILSSSIAIPIRIGDNCTMIEISPAPEDHKARESALAEKHLTITDIGWWAVTCEHPDHGGTPRSVRSFDTWQEAETCAIEHWDEEHFPLDEHPLLHPHEEAGLWNYPICGAVRVDGGRCRARAGWSSSGGDKLCNTHDPEQIAAREARKAEEAKRRAETLKQRRAREAREAKEREIRDRAVLKSTPGGSPLRTDLPDSIRERSSFTLIDPTTGRFALTPAEKVHLATYAPPRRKLILVWVGQWSSHAFSITAKEALDKLK
jgi:hypothetical protein